jgi:hypothetical protein
MVDKAVGTATVSRRRLVTGAAGAGAAALQSSSKAVRAECDVDHPEVQTRSQEHAPVTNNERQVQQALAKKVPSVGYTDTCLTIKDASAPVWLNPNIVLIGPKSGADRADPPTVTEPDIENTLKVNVHIKTETECQVNSSDSVRAEIWVSPPNASPPKVLDYTLVSTGAVFGTDLATLNSTGSFLKTLPPWKLPLTTTDPNLQPGHHCLRARVYLQSDFPAPSQFDLTNDHEGQHNICIVPCNSPCGLDFLVWTIQEEAVEVMTLRVVAEIRPDEGTLAALTGVMEQSPGFKQFVFGNSPSFEVNPGEAEVTDIRKDVDGLPTPNLEIDYLLSPGKPVTATFTTDLEAFGAGEGDAFVYHVMHLNQEKQVQSGLTIVALRAVPVEQSDETASPEAAGAARGPAEVPANARPASPQSRLRQSPA